MCGPHKLYLISIAVVILGKKRHEGIQLPVLLILGARVPPRDIRIPRSRLSRADDCRQPPVIRKGSLDGRRIELIEQSLERLLHRRKGFDLVSLQVVKALLEGVLRSE